ncbi:MAG: hemerythrin domain-containing protein [Sphingomonadaceae bacterium]|nr:hemerythrin domain-containing protein [Sphingomonadaceae bacterium]
MQNKNSNTKGISGQGAAIAAAVGGLAIGLMANAGRKAIMQGMDASYGEWDDVLKAEHEATIMIFDKIAETDEKQVTKRKMLLMQLKHALSKHAHEEENVVYPAMRENGLTEEADHLNHDHGYVKQYLFELTEMKPSDPAWLTKVEEFRDRLEEHVREEEDELFPKLRDQLGEDGNAHVTAAMNKEGFKLA